MKTFLPVLPNSLARLNINGHRETLDDSGWYSTTFYVYFWDNFP